MAAAATSRTLAARMGARVGSTPSLGLGTWLSPPGQAGAAVAHALRPDVGYKHIDCAPIYGNEAEIGSMAFAGMAPSVRDELHVTSKLWLTEQHPDNVRPALEGTLKDLQLDYLDLYLIHWPVALSRDSPGQGSMTLASKQGVFALRDEDFEDVSIGDTWGAMEALVEAGLVRRIGLSNCSIPKIKEVLSGCAIRPDNLQVELHPYLQQSALLDFCRAEGISVTAYSPLGSPGIPAGLKPKHLHSGPLLEDPVLVDIAAARGPGVTPAHVAIQWALQRGTITIPKSVTPARIEANRCLELAPASDGIGSGGGLTDDEMARIAALDRHERQLLGTFYCRPGQTVEDMWGHDGTRGPDTA